MARQGTARFTDGLSGWLRSALPGVVIDAPDEERGRRNRVVEATIYLVACSIGAAALADAWQGYPPWLRIVAVVAGIAALLSPHLGPHPPPPVRLRRRGGLRGDLN